MTTPIILNGKQDVLLDRLVNQMADRASQSDLPTDTYINGLQAFIFGSAGDRTHVLKREPLLFQRMERDQNMLLVILADADGNTLGLMTSLLALLKIRVKAAL